MKLLFNLLFVLLVMFGCSDQEKEQEKTGQSNLAYKWCKIALEATANNVGAGVTLGLTTFSETADMMVISRVPGAYHIQCENSEGLKMNRKVAAVVWKKYLVRIGKK